MPCCVVHSPTIMLTQIIKGSTCGFLICKTSLQHLLIAYFRTQKTRHSFLNRDWHGTWRPHNHLLIRSCFLKICLFFLTRSRFQLLLLNHLAALGTRSIQTVFFKVVNLDLLPTFSTLDWSSHSLNQISGMVYIIGGLILGMRLEFRNLIFMLNWNFLPEIGLFGSIWNIRSWFTEQILRVNVPFCLQNDWSIIEFLPWLEVRMQSLFWHFSVHRWFHHIWGVNVRGQTSLVTSSLAYSWSKVSI